MANFYLAEMTKLGYNKVIRTDLPITHVRHRIPSQGYSGMQEYYCHQTVDAARTDLLVKAMAGYVAMFMRLSILKPEEFKL